MTKILVVDDLRADRELMSAMLMKDRAWEVHAVENGREALHFLDRALPDAIVTDLSMPEMDGFELVATVKKRYPYLPVVLVTAKGSEDVAIRALKEGAASYVPKRLMAGNLTETIEGVLELATKKRGEARLKGYLRRHERRLEFVVDNDRDMLAPLVNFLQDNLLELGVCNESESLQVGMALDEALVNALYHGNLEVSSQLKEDDDRAYYQLARQRATESPYRERRIHVLADLNTDEARFVMRDEGPGFDPKELPDPTDPENLLKLSGRGILLMRTFMDDVQFNASGNEVTMIKRRASIANCGSTNLRHE
jgi:CheY-like chemotaxis protein/anti-sigma regulatory factor (Ser/Thr protein kinase)